MLVVNVYGINSLASKNTKVLLGEMQNHIFGLLSKMFNKVYIYK